MNTFTIVNVFTCIVGVRVSEVFSQYKMYKWGRVTVFTIGVHIERFLCISKQVVESCSSKPGHVSNLYVQYLQLIRAKVDRTSASAWLYKHPWVTCQNISTPMTHVDPKVKASFSCEVINATIQETGWQPDVRSCIMPRH